MAMEKDNTGKVFDFTEDSGVAKTPEEMKVALEAINALLKTDVTGVSCGGKPHPRLDYIDMEWIIKDANGRGTGVSLVLRADGTWEFWG